MKTEAKAEAERAVDRPELTDPCEQGESFPRKASRKVEAVRVGRMRMAGGDRGPHEGRSERLAGRGHRLSCGPGYSGPSSAPGLHRGEVRP